MAYNNFLFEISILGHKYDDEIDTICTIRRTPLLLHFFITVRNVTLLNFNAIVILALKGNSIRVLTNTICKQNTKYAKFETKFFLDVFVRDINTSCSLLNKL